MVPPESKKDWVPTGTAFAGLLAWLDQGADSGGAKYLEVRHRLTLYFDRKNCPEADELADETLNRVARRLQEADGITNVVPIQYCYITAKYLFLEYCRKADQRLPNRYNTSHHLEAVSNSVERPEEDRSESTERLLDCLEQCLERLPQADQVLILEYYKGDQRAKIQRRSELASQLGLTMNALSIRTCRIRNKLEACLQTCPGEK